MPARTCLLPVLPALPCPSLCPMTKHLRLLPRDPCLPAVQTCLLTPHFVCLMPLLPCRRFTCPSPVCLPPSPGFYHRPPLPLYKLSRGCYLPSFPCPCLTASAPLLPLHSLYNMCAFFFSHWTFSVSPQDLYTPLCLICCSGSLVCPQVSLVTLPCLGAAYYSLPLPSHLVYTCVACVPGDLLCLPALVFMPLLWEEEDGVPRPNSSQFMPVYVM